MANITPSQKSVIDEFGSRWLEFEDFRERTAGRLELLRKKITAYIADAPADQSCELSGNLYRVIATARSMTRVVEKKAMRTLFDQLGKDQFLDNCGFSIHSLEQLKVNPVGLLSEDRTGPRKLKARPIDPPKRTVRTNAARKAKAAISTSGAESASARVEGRA